MTGSRVAKARVPLPGSFGVGVSCKGMSMKNESRNAVARWRLSLLPLQSPASWCWSDHERGATADTPQRLSHASCGVHLLVSLSLQNLIFMFRHDTVMTCHGPCAPRSARIACNRSHQRSVGLCISTDRAHSVRERNRRRRSAWDAHAEHRAESTALVPLRARSEKYVAAPSLHHWSATDAPRPLPQPPPHLLRTSRSQECRC